MAINNHLHYGGSLATRSGKLGSKPKQGSNFSRQRRYETIIRLENAGFTSVAIAGMLCISPTRLNMLKRDPDYLAARVQLTHGIILDQEGKLAAIKEQRKEILKQNLPAALQVLADEIQRPAHTLAERKHKAAMALEYLDREGTFAKVSRTEVKPVDEFDFEKADIASKEIIKALNSTPAIGHHTKESLEANLEFSNSHTLSAVDQQAALDELETIELLETMSPVSDKVN